MTEQSFLFDFTRVKSFFEQWNVAFKLTDMNSSNNFRLVFASDSPNNIDDCLDNGVIDEDVVTYATQTVGGVTSDAIIPMSLKYENDTISIRNDTTWNIGNEPMPLKSVFITTTDGYVMAYSINISEFTVTNKIVFEGGVTLWRIIDD